LAGGADIINSRVACNTMLWRQFVSSTNQNMTVQDLTNKIKEFDTFVNSTIISQQEDTYPILDGIIDPERFITAKYKVLWILKEPYDDFDEDGTPFGGGWDLKAVIKSKNSIHEYTGGKPTFKPMVYASWGILNDFYLWDDMNNVEKDPSMLNALKSVAYINVKKLPGRKSTHYSICNEAYKSHKDLLLEQIELINADIIIGGGTLHHFIKDLQLSGVERHTQGSANFFLNDNKIYIQAYHPAQRTSSTGVSQEQYCNDIILAVKTWATQ